MSTIKIVSNPYEREIEYFVKKGDCFVNICEQNDSLNSKLREDDYKTCFLPFKIKDIIDILIKEYYVLGESRLNVIFEGANDEFKEVQRICEDESYASKINLVFSDRELYNARQIKEQISEEFKRISRIIYQETTDEKLKKKIEKIERALENYIPVCVFGNYSSGKSTLINALIGRELLPSGGDAVTARVYEIRDSKQDDYARISFLYEKESVEIALLNDGYKLVDGNAGIPIVKEIQSTLETNRDLDIIGKSSKIIELINSYSFDEEIMDKLGLSVCIDVPFLKRGILGNTDNQFVIFDTPGSNSNSNEDHTRVLEEAMSDFSNGIPIWVATYESMDSNDNAELCKRILGIESLDSRFTLIVLNKCDDVDLDGCSEKVVLGKNSIKSMYSGGVFFVSSVMGLGSKLDGKILGRHYRREYAGKKNQYSDQDDEFYDPLYKYDILPAQMKDELVKNAKSDGNLIYANSGLLSLESMMDLFAENYATYNKCKMVYDFTMEVIDGVQNEITTSREELSQKREDLNARLDEDRKNLLNACRETVHSADSLKTELADDIQSIENEVADLFKRDDEWFKEKTDSIYKSIRDDRKTDYDERKDEYEEADSAMRDHFNENKHVFRDGKFFENLEKLIDEGFSDWKKRREKIDANNELQADTFNKTSDEVIELVNEEYQNNISDASEIVIKRLREFWLEKYEQKKDDLEMTINNSDALSDEEKTDVVNMISNYQPAQKNVNEEKFVKEKYLQGVAFWLLNKLESKKLNLDRLQRQYDKMITRTIKEIVNSINKNEFNSFIRNLNSLLIDIEMNVIKYSPELSKIQLEIAGIDDTITAKKERREELSKSRDKIRKLISWDIDEQNVKEVEG